MMSAEQHVDAVKSKNNIIKTIRSDVFVALKQLTNDTKAVRVKGAFDLLQHLHKQPNHNDENTVRVQCKQPIFKSQPNSFGISPAAGG